MDDPTRMSGPDANTRILAELAHRGFDTDLRPAGEGPTLLCEACRSVSDAADFPVAFQGRAEGASDPADMVLIVAANCPVCGAGGTVILGYGPSASAADSDVVAALRPAREASDWVP